MFLSGEKIKGERCMSAEGSSVKGSSQQSSISFLKVKGEGLLFSGLGQLITGGVGKQYYTHIVLFTNPPCNVINNTTLVSYHLPPSPHNVINDIMPV